MRHILLFLACGLALAACKSAEQRAQEAAVLEAQEKDRATKLAEQRASAIKAKAETEARFLCEHSLGKTPGTEAYSRCVQDAYRLKIANEIEAFHQREEQRKIEALRILSDAYSRHGSVTCTQAFGTTQCNY